MFFSSSGPGADPNSCAGWGGGSFIDGSITLNFVDPGGSSEAIELTILNCRPYVAVGTSSVYGRIVVTGNY